MLCIEMSFMASSVLLLLSLCSDTHGFVPESKRSKRFHALSESIDATTKTSVLTCNYHKNYRLDGRRLQKLQAVSSSSDEQQDAPFETEIPIGSIGNITIVLPDDADIKISKFGSKSPVPQPNFSSAAAHLTKKIFYFSDGGIKADVVSISQATTEQLLNVDFLLAMGLSNEQDIKSLEDIFSKRRERDSAIRNRQCQLTVDCSVSLPASVGPYDETSPSIASNIVPWSTDATGLRMYEQMMGLFDRYTSDDFAVAVMIFFNQFSGKKVPWVKHSIDATWEKGPVQNAKEFYNMISKCGDCIGKCLADETCKECLTALNALDTRDQVASYRTIVSFESDLLRDFSFCILQKNNIFECESKIPSIPKVEPLARWRRKAMTTDMARSLLVGHLDDDLAPKQGKGLDVSWKVTCGANVAYDQFPSQNQLFYEAVSGRDMWYDPIFRVETIDGRSVWCKRHYKVRNGPKPGTFYLSVLDNGITSSEFWTIVDVADDLSWIIFHYAGAASAVGQRYLGGLLCTPDGTLPPQKQLYRIWKSLSKAGIAPWELFVVDNNMTRPKAIEAGPPPVDFFRSKVLQAKEAKRNAQVS